jgi:hypothetical protein
MALASAFPAGPQARDRPCGKEIGRRGRRSAGPRRAAQPGARRPAVKQETAGPRARARPGGRGQPIWHEISRTARRGPAGRKEAGRSSRRSAGPRARVRPSRREDSRSGRRSAGPRMSSAKPEGPPRSGRRSAGHVGRAAWAAAGEAAPWAGPRGETPPEVTRARQRKRPLHA